MTLAQFLVAQVARVALTPWWQSARTFHPSTRPNPRALPPAPGPEPWHGTMHGYKNLLCRCLDCRKANASHKRYLAIRARAKREGA